MGTHHTLMHASQRSCSLWINHLIRLKHFLTWSPQTLSPLKLSKDATFKLFGLLFWNVSPAESVTNFIFSYKRMFERITHPHTYTCSRSWSHVRGSEVNILLCLSVSTWWIYSAVVLNWGKMNNNIEPFWTSWVKSFHLRSLLCVSLPGGAVTYNHLLLWFYLGQRWGGDKRSDEKKPQQEHRDGQHLQEIKREDVCQPHNHDKAWHHEKKIYLNQWELPCRCKPRFPDALTPMVTKAFSWLI